MTCVPVCLWANQELGGGSIDHASDVVGMGRVGGPATPTAWKPISKALFLKVTAIASGLQTHEGSLHICLQAGQPVSDGVPQDVEVNTVVSVTQPVPHTTDIAPGLARRQLSGFFPQAKGGLADTFQAPLDCITPECVASKCLPV